MSELPVEFTKAYIEQASPPDALLYVDFLSSAEPYRSPYRKDVHTAARGGFTIAPGKGPSGHRRDRPRSRR